MPFDEWLTWNLQGSYDGYVTYVVAQMLAKCNIVPPHGWGDLSPGDLKGWTPPNEPTPDEDEQWMRFIRGKGDTP